MSEAFERIKAQVDQLSEEERQDLASYLVGLECPNGEAAEDDDPAFDSELSRRFEDIRSGRAKGTPAFEFLDEMRRKYLQ
ncbi:MAG: hypothetical protein U0746_15290 [Gemmataceae bacterium]